MINPYNSPGVYYHKITGECEKTRSSNNNNDYDGLVISDGTHVFIMSKIVFWNNYPQAASNGPRWIESVYMNGSFVRKEYFVGLEILQRYCQKTILIHLKYLII